MVLQAYLVELESMVGKLEEENEVLVKEKVMQLLSDFHFYIGFVFVFFFVYIRSWSCDILLERCYCCLGHYTLLNYVILHLSIIPLAHFSPFSHLR